MGLLPLEFTECLIDSPFFRENLHSHEKELKQTSQDIKTLIKQIKELLNAAKVLSKAQRTLATTLLNFKLECIGSSQTEDEIVIEGSLKEFGRLLQMIEDERDRLLEQSQEAFIDPLEKFRKEEIGTAKETQKKFEKETVKFSQSLEQHLSHSTTKKTGNFLQEADACLEMKERHFYQTSLEYVFMLQGVQEKKKFEFVETILAFMYAWLTFYHEGHEIAKDFKPIMTDLQLRLQRTRENYYATHDEAEKFMKRMLEKCHDPGSLSKNVARQGYMYLMEKKPLGTAWNKYFCQFHKDPRRRTLTMIPCSLNNTRLAPGETVTIKDCIRRMTDSIDKRFCFDVIGSDGTVFTLQALSAEDRRAWLDVMDGKEPTYSQPGKLVPRDTYQLDEAGFQFVRDCIAALEASALREQGLYRLPGVMSKVRPLLQAILEQKKSVNLMTSKEYDARTLSSALKYYLRFLKEPLLTYRLHSAFIAAAKRETRVDRLAEIQSLVSVLPPPNREMTRLLAEHLANVASQSEHNLMTAANLAVCLGPSLLRPEEESVAAIMELKFANVVVQTIIENCPVIFRGRVPPQQTNGHQPAGVGRGYVRSMVHTMYSHPTAAEPPAPRPMPRSRAARLPPGPPESPRHNGSGSSNGSPTHMPPPPPAPHKYSSSRHRLAARDNSMYSPSYSAPPDTGWRVQALYSCVGEGESELSFEPNDIIHNVKPSVEPGWLQGYHNGKFGLFPQNYVKILPS